jgi:hypothetical protein
MSPRSNSILLIQVPGHAAADLIDFFIQKQQSWTEVSRFSEAIRYAENQNFAFALCEWELFQASHDNFLEAQSLDQLLAKAIPLIFLSAAQTAAVRFKYLNGHRFYSLRKADSPTLLPIIAELACQIAKEQRQEDEALVASNLTTKIPLPPRPHFTIPLMADPAMANSSIHLLN